MCKGFFLKQKNTKGRKERQGRRGDLICVPKYGKDGKLKWKKNQAGPVDQYDHVIKSQTFLCDMKSLRGSSFYLS